MIKKVLTLLIVLVIGTAFTVPCFAEALEESQPRVMVTDYSVIGVSYPGSVFQLKIIATNKGSRDVSNIKITFNEPSGALLPWKVDSYYISHLGAGESNNDNPIEFTVKVNEECDGGNMSASVNIEYEDESGQSFSSSDTIMIPVIKKPKETEVETKPNPYQPVLMVTDYSVDGTVLQGKSFKLNIVITNKSITTNIVNIKISCADQTGQLTPAGVTSGYIRMLAEGESYTWSVPVKVSSDAEGGNCPVTITCEYETQDGENLSSTDTLVLSIPKKPKEKDTTADTSQPRLMVTDYSIENDYISPDEVGKLSITVENTCRNKTVSNIKLSLVDESGELKAEGTGTTFIRSIGPGRTYVWETNITAAHTAQTGEHILTVNMEYEDSNKTPYTSSDRLGLDIRQDAKLSYNGAQLPVKVTQGDTVTLSITLMNTGKSTLSNCIIETDVPKLESGGGVLVGEIKSGESKTGSVNLRVDSDFKGETKGTVTIKYEDEFGEVYEDKADLTTYVQEKVLITDAEEKGEEKKNSLWWLFAVIGVIVGGGAGAVIPIAVNSARQRKIDEETL
ncbi:MAG: hypothetical protein IK085_02045 [Clostridia bacterium]|nr:hypothetical protein [Clostridia bacterium]